MKKFIMALILVSSMLISGCAYMEGASERAANSDIVFRAGTAEYIGGDVEKAQDVVEWTETAIETIEGTGENILLAKFREEADKRIPWNEMSPGRRILADELLLIIEIRISDEIDEGVLSKDAVENIIVVLEVINTQAQRELLRAQ